MRVAIYLRLRAEDQGRQGYSLNEQRNSCREKAAAMGADHIVEFVDEAAEGSALNLPGLSALLDAAADRQLDVIVAVDPDRFDADAVKQPIGRAGLLKTGVRLEYVYGQNKAGLRVAIYLRVSTEDQAKRGYSLPDQRRSCREKAAAMGATHIVEFVDEAVTGATLDRPGLSALRDAVAKEEVDVIIALDPDRFHRKLINQLVITEEIEKAGVRLEFLNFTIEHTPEGRMFYSIRGAIAEYEKEKIRDRTLRGKKQKARMGGIPTDFTAYGYTYSPETGKVAVCARESLIIREIFEWWTTEDVGVNTIARRLNNQGVPTKRRRSQWHRRTVQQMLENPVYKGEWHYTDVVIPVPALVTPDTWEKAQEKLKAARRLYAGKSRYEYLLSGLVTCGDCLQTMCGIAARWWGRTERRYTCAKHWEGTAHRGCRPVKMVLADCIEQVVWDQVCAWLHDPDALADELTKASPAARMNDLQREMVNIDYELGQLDKGRRNVLEAVAAGLVDLDDISRADLARFRMQEDKLNRRKMELVQIIQDEEGRRMKVDEVRSLAADTLNRLDDLGFTEKKAIVRALVAQVVIYGRPAAGGQGYHGVSVTVIARIPKPEVVVRPDIPGFPVE